MRSASLEDNLSSLRRIIVCIVLKHDLSSEMSNLDATRLSVGMILCIFYSFRIVKYNRKGQAIMILYQLYKATRMTVAKASSKREWMDQTDSKFAYRCLPLSIANSHGYVFSLKKPVQFMWNGKNTVSDITIKTNPDNMISSIFGNGIITIHLDYIVTTDKGDNIVITGPHNQIFPGMHHLTGIYESDWAPFSFTMNYKITHPEQLITITPNQPICQIYPIPRNYIEEDITTIKHISENPQLESNYQQFSDSRGKFLSDHEGNKESLRYWQKTYFKGEFIDGTKCPFDHKTKLNLPPIETIYHEHQMSDPSSLEPDTH